MNIENSTEIFGENLLEVRNLGKKYTGFALQDVSFNLKKGYIMGFIGPNGAGKTTTIKLIMNLIKKDSGEIKVFGQDHVRAEKQIKERIGFVYDEQEFFDELKVPEVEKIVAPLYRNWDRQAYARYVKELKMKFSLAIALAHQADLLIMDEPTSGLDPVFRQEFLDLMLSFVDEEKGVLFSSHITSDLDKIADYVTFINQGRIVFSYSRETVLEKYGLVKGEKKNLPDELRQQLIGLREGNFGFEALTDDAQALRKKFGGEMGVSIERPSLEQIMLFLVKGEKKDV